MASSAGGSNPISLASVGGSYTVATVPTASSRVGQTIYVTNGKAGAADLAYSDGTNWRNRSDGTIISAGTYDPNTIPNLYGQFNPGGSGTTWADAKGGAGTGTLANGATWSSGAVQLDGSNDEVNAFTNLISPVVSTTGRTLCFWATNTDAAFARRGFMGTRPASSSAGFFFSQKDSATMFYALVGGASWSPTVTMPAAGTRTFWALTHDFSSGVATLFKAGSQVAQLTSLGGAETAPTTFKGVIGAEQETQTTEHWQGSIDRVLVYTRALTASEISTLASNLT